MQTLDDDDVALKILTAKTDSRTEINLKLDTLVSRIDAIENTTSDLKTTLNELIIKNSGLEANVLSISEGCGKMKDDINLLRENTDRLSRKNNLMVFNVPEKDEQSTENTINSLLSIILPTKTNPQCERVGRENGAHSRPIRVYLNTYYEKKLL